MLSHDFPKILGCVSSKIKKTLTGIDGGCKKICEILKPSEYQVLQSFAHLAWDMYPHEALFR